MLKQWMAGGVLALAALLPAVQPPTDFSIPSARKIFEKTRQDTLNFWTRPEVADPAGGYRLWFDADGNACTPNPASPAAPDAGKPLLSELRVLWAHAVAIPCTADPAERARLRRQYEHGFAFLDRYRDPATGLFIKAVDENGNPSNRDITAITQAYVVYIMSEIAGEISDRRAFDLAQSTFEKLDQLAHDPEHGGYFEALRPAANRDKSVGTNLHMALALARLMKVNPTGPARARLAELVGILTSEKLLHPASGNGYMLMTADWKPKRTQAAADMQVLYGHNAELVWYVLEAAEMLRIHPDELRPWLKRVSAPIIRHGIFPDGKAAIFGPFEGEPQPVEVPRWWTQLELMNMLLRMYEVTGEAEYYALFEKAARFSYAHLVNPANGVWYGGVNLKTGERFHQGGWAWKSGLHVIRAMRLMSASLDRLREGWKPVRRYKTAADLPRRAIQVSLGYPYNHNRSAASLVSEVKANGYDAIFLIIKEKELLPKDLVRTARAAGLQVWGSFFGPATFMPDSLFPPESENWRMEFTVKRPNRYFSYVHKPYQEWWKRYLATFYDRNQFDGFVFYESHYGTRFGKGEFFGDISPGFIEHFQRNTGHSKFPNFTDPAHPDYYKTNIALYRDYVEYRLKSINDFYREIWDGEGGLRRRHPEVIFGSWTIALAGDETQMAEMREAEAQDGARMVAGTLPDFHFLQSHWPDWIPEKQTPEYLTGYRPYMKAVRDAFPGLPLAVQGDFASTVPYRRTPGWERKFERTAKRVGFDFTAFYEFHVRHQVHFDPPRPVSGEVDAAGNGCVVFDQVISPESANTQEGRALTGNRKLTGVRTDGNLLLFNVGGPVSAAEAVTVPLAGITDDPSLRVPMPGIGTGRVNPVPPETRIRLQFKGN